VTVDDMHCATCNADVYSLNARSVAVVEWNPASRSNTLLATLCSNPACMRDWAVNHATAQGKPDLCPVAHATTEEEDECDLFTPLDEQVIDLAQTRKEYGEFLNAGSTHACPYCQQPTVYRVFSGGKEWYCEGCDETGFYPDGQAPSRAGLLATPEGREVLREDMRAELDRRKIADDTPRGPVFERGTDQADRFIAKAVDDA
jgi:ribosomal protein L37AE/L43A